MANQRQSFGEKIKTWREMQGNLKPQLGDLPYLKDAHDQLEQGIGSAEDLQLRLITIRSQLADAVQQKRKLITTNNGLHDRIGSALHFQHGPDSKELIQFGLKPASRTRRSPSRRRGPPRRRQRHRRP